MAILEAPLRLADDGSIAPRTAAVATSTNAADAKDKPASQTVATRPSLAYLAVGLGLLVLGFVGGLLLQRAFHPNMTKLPVLPAGVGAFALLYVMAQAIERLLVPVSWFGGGFLGGVKTKVNGAAAADAAGLGRLWLTQNSKAALAKTHQAAQREALENPGDPVALQAAANAKHDVDQYRANLTAITFGLAALLAMMVSGYVGIFLLHVIGLHTAGWLDVLVTGLAIAGGTKPLHGLISNISSAKK
jgi:hypothetical protein